MKTRIIIPLLILIVLIVLVIVRLPKDSDDTVKTLSLPVATTTAPIATSTSVTPTTNSYTLAQVATHNSQASCWSAISGKVYDLTAWISQHPGGSRAILSICGKDGTAAFTGKHGGQARPASELAGFDIGVLVQ